jgi:hypothetical protein
MSINYEQCWREINNFCKGSGEKYLVEIMKDIEEENTSKDKPTIADVWEAFANDKLFVKLNNGEIHKVIQNDGYRFIDDLHNDFSFSNENVEFIIK